MPESTLGHDPHGRMYARGGKTFEGGQRRLHVVPYLARGLDFRLTAAF